MEKAIRASLLPALFVVFALVAADLATAASAANMIYWTAPYHSNEIYFAKLDGSSVSPGTVTTTGATADSPWGSGFDLSMGKIYWANYRGNTISWANLDGSGAGDLVTTGATVSGPIGVVVDQAAGKIYWANNSGTTISWANLDGSGGGDLDTTGATVNVPLGVAIDAVAGRIYWANYNSSQAISYADLAGGNGGDLNVSGATLGFPWGVAIDLGTNKVYWGNYQAKALDFADLSGSGGGVLATTGATNSSPFPGAIDPATGRVYWGNWGGPRGTATAISWANLDGSGGQDLYTSPAAGPAMPVLLEVPAGTAPPAITASSSGVPATLTCMPGRWAADDLGRLVYRMPRSVSYSWELNGSPIAGATSNTLNATTQGSYTCQETATNFAGSTTQTSAPASILGTLAIPALAPWGLSLLALLLAAAAIVSLAWRR